MTGGYVYRGAAMPELVGQYVFGDFVKGKIWAYVPGQPSNSARLLVESARALGTFAEDQDGELYVVDYATGQIARLVPSGSSSASAVATTLSRTGCAQASDPRLPADGMLAYEMNSPAVVRRRREDALARPSRGHPDRGRGGRRLHVSDRLGAAQGLRVRRQARRDPAAHAPRRRRRHARWRMGWLLVPVGGGAEGGGAGRERRRSSPTARSGRIRAGRTVYAVTPRRRGGPSDRRSSSSIATPRTRRRAAPRISSPRSRRWG